MTYFSRIAAGVALVLCIAGPAASQSLEAKSNNGLYHLAIEPASAPAINVMEGWTLTLHDSAGAAVEGAAITITGGMPAHGHGLPTEPAVTADLGEGRYLVEGMKFNMMGHWVIDFQIEAEPGSDTARLELDL